MCLKESRCSAASRSSSQISVAIVSMAKAAGSIEGALWAACTSKDDSSSSVSYHTGVTAVRASSRVEDACEGCVFAPKICPQKNILCSPEERKCSLRRGVGPTSCGCSVNGACNALIRFLALSGAAAEAVGGASGTTLLRVPSSAYSLLNASSNYLESTFLTLGFGLLMSAFSVTCSK